MPKPFLARTGAVYRELAPGAVYESSVVSIVEANAHALFPEFACRRLEPYFQTAAGDVQPDLILIGRSEHIWGMVEVEAQEHSAIHHVKPQIAKMRFARVDDRNRQKITESFEDEIELDHILACLTGQPIVYLVTHGLTPVPIEDLRTLFVRGIDLEIFHSPPNDYILKVDGKAQRLIELPLGAKRSNSPLTQSCWQIGTQAIPALDKSGSHVRVEFDGVGGVWNCQRTSDGYLLRMPSGLLESITATEARVYLDPDDAILVMSTNER